MPKAANYRTIATALLLFVAIIHSSSSLAGGVRDLPISSLPFARSLITVDGNLSDWPDVRPVRFVPLDTGLTTSSADTMKTLAALDIRPTVQACYDHSAFYIGITWYGASSTRAEGNVEVMALADRMARVRFVVHKGTSMLGQVLSDAGTSWQTVPDGPIAAKSMHGGVTSEEIRIPWRLVSGHNSPPTTKLTIALDFSWSEITPAFLKQLPPEILHDNTHQTFCFLTSPEKLFTNSAYLGSPSDWGTLHFVDGPHAYTVQYAPTATGTKEMYVSRIASPFKVDGNLGDWPDDWFQTATYLPAFLGKRYSADVASTYDADNLYVAVRYKSAGGPFNTKAEQTQAGYAGGDCLQIRLNDGSRTVNICGWYDSIDKKPALTADGNDLQNPFLLAQGAQEAFIASEDGSGYTQEIAIPWKLIHASGAPAPGDNWRGTFQFWWAGLEPQFTEIATADLESAGSISVSYTLPIESNVTVTVFDKGGHLIRNLAKDSRRFAGKNVEHWDGRDQFGQPVSPGEYVIKGLRHSPIDTTYVMSAVNPGTPPWPTADGTGDWLSDEASVQAAATDGENVYLASPGSEKGFAIIEVGRNGKKIWGYQDNQNPRCVSLAVDGNLLYALFSGPELTDSSQRFNGTNATGRAYIICLDKDTGALAAFSAQRPHLRVATWPYVDHTSGLWDLRNNRSFSPATYGGQTRYFANDLGEPTEALGIAALGGKLYVSLFNENQILVLDASSGKQIDTIEITRPVGLHCSSDGRLLAVSDGKVAAVDPAAKTVTVLVANDLQAPHDLTTDRDGNIYVSDWGGSFQVKVFSPGGKLIRTIGKEGGRPWVGPWVRDALLLPRGLAVTSDGFLWVAEDDAAPSRVSVWNAATGQFVRDYLGPTPYGGAGTAWLDPQDPTLFLGEGVFWRLDMANKTWTPLATAFRRMGLDEPFTPNAQYGPSGCRTIEHDGKQYLYISNGYNLTVLRRDNLSLTPVAAIGCRGRFITDQGASQSIWDSDIGTHSIGGYFPPYFDGHKGDDYIWVDSNGDGKVQANEIQWSKTWTRGDVYSPERLPEFLANWGCGVSKSGAVFIGGFCKNNDAIVRFDPQGWTASGAPVFTFESAKVVLQDNQATTPQGLYVTDSDKLLVSRPYEWSRYRTALDAYSVDGNPLWSMAMPDKQASDDIESDQVTGELHTKAVGDIVETWLWHGNYKSYLVTDDGLYITSLLDDTKLGPKATWDESFRSVYQEPNGDAYIINGANDAYHILKITGLDTIDRFSGPVIVTAQDLANVAQGIQSVVQDTPLKPVIHVDWRTQSTDQADTPADAVTLRGDGDRSARVTISRDATNLYATYEVHGSKLVNKGANWQTLFITGDCADLMLSTSSGELRPHFAPAAGDERVLFSIYQGKPIAVLYRPVVPGTTAPLRFMAASIDQVIRLDSADVEVRRTADGYILSATVPLNDIGIDLSRIDALRGDVGVIYADATGTNRAQRVYYYNQHTATVSDLTTEATLQPGEWGEIELPLGENLLKNGGFSKPLSAKPEDGWQVRAANNGIEVGTDDNVSYAGGRSLLVRQTAPVIFDDKAYLIADYGDYIKSANGGKGGGDAQIVQNVPVTAGKSYHFRLHYLSQDLQPEVKECKPGRGYAALEVWLYWLGNVKNNGAVWIANEQDDPIGGWKTIVDTRFNNFGVSAPYTAPEGATGVQVAIYVATNASGKLPVVHIGDVELTEAK